MSRLLPLLLACLLTAACSQSPAEDSANAVANEANAAQDNALGNEPAEPASDNGVDAKVAGTDFHAIAEIPCGLDQELDASCSAGVTRNSGPDGTSFVEVTKPDGTTRILFFQGTKASGADSSTADGSSRYRFLWHREADWTVIRYGPERYRVPDALIVGG